MSTNTVKARAGGIVTEQLTRSLSEDIRTRGLLVWLDRDGVYSEYADSLAERHAEGEFPYPVFAFRGSFVRLMRESHPVLAGAQMPRCVIHLPGFSEESIKTTPLYEAYKAGRRWRIALETVVRDAARGHLTPQQLDALVAREDLTLESADRALAEQVEVTPELRALLTHYGEDGLVTALLTYAPGVISRFEGDETTLVDALQHRLERHLGMDAQWIIAWAGTGGAPSGIPSLAYALWAFLLCREYAADNGDPPPSDRLARLRELPREYHQTGARILETLRRTHGDVYAAASEEVASALTGEETSITPERLGTVDTFRFEAEAVLAEAFRLLDEGQWSEARNRAHIRRGGTDTGTPSFWVSRDPGLGRIWKWIAAAGELGEALDAERSAELREEDLAHESRQYRDHRWRIDRHHRAFAVLSATVGVSGIGAHVTIFSRIRSQLARMYRQWIDTVSRAWNSACEQQGFLPAPREQQRHFFREHVAPYLREGHKTALVLADALRFELGRELEAQFQGEYQGTVELTALLAELPTVTAVGMNALAPTVDGDELIPLFSPDGSRITGFRGGTRDVTSPAARQKTFADRSGVSCDWQDLNQFLALDQKKAQHLAENQLLILATATVDNEGEGDALSAGIDYFDTAMNSVSAAIRRLMELGYSRIIVTADHGFIIGDDTVRTGGAAQLPRADRRYLLGEPRTGEDLVSVPLGQVQYRSEERQKAIIFDRTSHILSSRPAGSFYHGGNTPQERIIPMLTITSGKSGHREPGQYRLSCEALPDVLGQHRIRVTATETSAAALFEKEPLEVRVVAEEAITVTVADVTGAVARGDLVTLQVGMPCEIYFRLRGPTARSRLRFVSTRRENTIENPDSPAFFDVDLQSSGDGQQPDPVATRSWLQHIEEMYHPALRHLEQYGTLSQRYLVNSLGGGPKGNREARRFASRIDQWRPYLPFRVEVHDTVDQGKEYRIP